MRTHDTMEQILDSYRLEPRAWERGRNILAGVMVVAWAAAAGGFALDRAQFGFSYLTGFAYAATLVIGALFFVMLQHVTGAAWSVTSRRVAENVMAVMPVAALLFVPLAFAMPHVYPWMNAETVAESQVLQGKQAYLNQTFFIIRAAAYFVIWGLWAYKLYRISTAQDEGRGDYRSGARWSAPGLILLTITITLASFDWIMSLDPLWYSTIFGVYVFSGAGLSFVALLIVLMLGFRRADALRYSVNHEHYHDLGKWLFALTVFWAYIAFCQYLLIWYANIPEETEWFRHRIAGGWAPAAALLVLGHFIAPFLLLISRGAKRRLPLLAAVAGWMLLMHYIDLYWLIMPAFSEHHPAPHWMDAAGLLAPVSAIGLAFWYKLRSHALIPTGDVRLEEALEFHNV